MTLGLAISCSSTGVPRKEAALVDGPLATTTVLLVAGSGIPVHGGGPVSDSSGLYLDYYNTP
ncbi:hypothetical protein ACJX0J_007207, partial [Zea mays]